MGMFSTNNFYVESAIIDDESIIAQECFEDNMHVAALRVVAESENNWNQIMQAMAISELAAYEETGDADYYITESGSGFLESVKAFFRNLMEKVKGIFQKLISTIDSWAKDDKAFVNKYKDKILKATTKDFEFEGYKFTYKIGNVVDVESVKNASLSDFEQYKDGQKDHYDKLKEEFSGDKLTDLLDEERANLIKDYSTSGYNSDSCDASDFNKELFEALRDGESSKNTIDNISPTDYIRVISNTADVKKNAKKAYDNVIKGIQKAYNSVDKAAKEIGKPVPKDANSADRGAYVGFCGAFSGYLRNFETLNVQAYGALLQAIKDENRQAKAVCVKLMSYKPKNESASYYEEGGSLLGNVRFI